MSCFVLILFFLLLVAPSFIYPLVTGVTVVLWGGSLLETSYELNHVTACFFLMLAACSFVSLIFSAHYLCDDSPSFKYYLVVTLKVFIVTMVLLVCCKNHLCCLVLWELLGLISFLLIAYNRSDLSCRASSITAVTARLGDVCLIVALCFSASVEIFYSIPSLLSWLIVGSKSATFPLMSWLLQAMRAPTPVSCLVHSSTLVAAGVWFGVRFGGDYSSQLVSLLVILSLISVGVTSVLAIIVKDMKQVVALSTCNTISWCLLSLGLGDILCCLSLLLVHGVTKCLLFTFMGDIFKSSAYNQNMAGLSKISGISSVSLFSLFSLVSTLSGLPAIGVFFIKHLILANSFIIGNTVVLLSLFLLANLGYCYSFRIFFSLCCPHLGRVQGLFTCSMLSSFLSFLSWLYEVYLSSSLPISDILSSGGDYMLLFGIMFQVVSVLLGYSLSRSTPQDELVSYSVTLSSCESLVVLYEWVYFYSSKLVGLLGIFRWDALTVGSLLNSCLKLLDALELFSHRHSTSVVAYLLLTILLIIYFMR